MPLEPTRHVNGRMWQPGQSGNPNGRLGDRVKSAPAQPVMFVPRGTPHTFQNIGTEPGVLLVGVTPGGFEKSLQERQVRTAKR